MQLNFQNIKIGDTIPILVKEPITRTTLALFAGASHDLGYTHLLLKNFPLDLKPSPILGIY